MSNEFGGSTALWRSYGYENVQGFLFAQEMRCKCGVEAYLNYELRRLYLVANRRKNRGQRNANTSGQGDWKGFINIPLSDDHKNLIRTGAFSLDEGLETIREMLAEGHKISVSLNREQNSVTAAATGVGEHCPNEGYTLSAFAADFTDAITVLAFKHTVIAKGDWSAFRQMKEDSDFG